MHTITLPPQFEAFAYFEAEHQALLKQKRDEHTSFEQLLREWAVNGRAEWRKQHLE